MSVLFPCIAVSKALKPQGAGNGRPVRSIFSAHGQVFSFEGVHSKVVVPGRDDIMVFPLPKGPMV